MSIFFWKSKKSSGKPAVSETETDAIPTVDTSGHSPNPSKKKVNLQVETKKVLTPSVSTSSYEASSSKKKVNKTHFETPKTAIPTGNTSSHSQSKTKLNMVHIGTVNNGTVSIGNQFVTRYTTGDHGDYGSSFSSARRRTLPTISEELKSSTLPLSVDQKYHIAENIGSNWKKLARMLPDSDFSDGALQTLDQTSENRIETVVSILNKWYEGAPSTATVGNLAKTLERMGLNDLAIGLETK